jgi:ABC-type bacteriocin/lantibiotic exporter with double-glycine peptidase domain
MTLKFAKRGQVALFTLLAAVKACNVIFVAYMIKLMLNLTTSHSHQINRLLTLAGIAALGQICFMLSNFCYERVKMTMIRDVNLVFKRANLVYLVQESSGNIKNGLSLMTNDLKQIETNRITAQIDMIYQGIVFVGSLGFAFYNSWEMTVVFLLASLAPALVQMFTSKLIAKKAAVWTQKNAIYTQNISDSLNGASAAKLYNVQPTIVQRAMHSAVQMENALRSMNFTQAWALELIYSAAELFCFVLPCTVGGVLMMQGRLAVGTMVMMVDLAMNFITPVVTIFQEFNQVKSTTPMWQRTLRALAYKPAPAVHVQHEFTGLEIKDLGYLTHSDHQQIFSHVYFSVRPHEKVLLMAPSGWGKTTLLKILQGVKTPNQGQILINQQDVSGNWQLAHNYFSYVNQKPFLFDDSLRFNLTLGRPVRETDLQAAIKKAGLTELVVKEGLDYQVGEDGNNLSGGQIQRVEIARALLSKRPILLADEATSALDPALSLDIHKTLLRNDHIAVIEVAHKISDQEKAMFDQIIDLKDLAHAASKN